MKTSNNPAFIIDALEVDPRIAPAYGERKLPKLDPTRAIEVKNGAFFGVELSLIRLKIYGIVKEPAIPVIMPTISTKRTELTIETKLIPTPDKIKLIGKI